MMDQDADRAAWRANLEAIYDELMAKPVGELFDAKAVSAAVEALYTEEALRDGWKPLARLAWILLLGQLKDDKHTVGSYVPEAQRAAIDEWVRDPDVVPERLIREMADDEAVRETIAALIYDALREFQDKVNPFFSEWGLPALLKRLGPFGFGGVAKLFDSVRAEFERRLEPEMRRFLASFAGRGAERVASHVIDHAGDPAFIALRQRTMKWLLDQEVAALFSEKNEALADGAEEIARETMAFALQRPIVRERRRLMVEQLIVLHAKQPLSEALAAYGIKARPSFDVIAAATWPIVRAALATRAGRAWLASVPGAG